MSHIAKRILGVLYAAMLGAACLGGPSQPATIAPTASAVPSPADAFSIPTSGPGFETMGAPPVPPPSVDVPPPTPDPNAIPLPLPPVHEDPDLDVMLGITVAGVELATSSLVGEDAASGGGYLAPLLATLGRGTSDLATGLATDPGRELPLVLFAVKVRGTDQATLLEAFTSVNNLGDADVATIAGKSIIHVPGDWTTYIYASGSVVIVVQSSEFDLAEEALYLLP